MAGGSLAERRDAHQRGAASARINHGPRWSVAIRVPVDRRTTRTRHPDAVAFDATVELAAVLVQVEDGVPYGFPDDNWERVKAQARDPSQ
jgi:hypothetical protein